MLKRVLLFCVALSPLGELPAQTVTVDGGGAEICGSHDLDAVGPDATGRLVFSGSYAALISELRWSVASTRWEYRWDGQLIMFSTYASTPRPPDDATATAAGMPWTAGATCTGPFSVTGNGTQNFLPVELLSFTIETEARAEPTRLIEFTIE